MQKTGTGQTIFEGTDSYRNIEMIMADISCRKVLVVCGGSFRRSNLPDFFAEKNINYCAYDGFSPNPTYEEVLEGLRVFQENQCDFLISIGGGSAIDVAKCIKAFAHMDASEDYIDQKITDSGIMHLAMPTTAGTGSESTHFAVIYKNGEKQSVSDESLRPEYVILEPSLLATLPDYQKKATLLDALCQAVESYWAVKADEESRAYAKEAITLILRYAKPYIRANENLIEIFHAANLAGRAIDLTQTTLAHAMSYKLTSLYGIAHGHAVALCMPYAWEYLAHHTDSLRDGVSKRDMEDALIELNRMFRCKTTGETVEFFRGMLAEFGLKAPKSSPEDLEVLAKSVNAQRLKNYPAQIGEAEFREMYRLILSRQDTEETRSRLLYTTACDLWEMEGFTEGKRQRMLSLKVREADIERRAGAAKTFLEAVWAYCGCKKEEEKLLSVISELCIALRGYALETNADVINYKNAVKILKPLKRPLSDEDLKEVKGLREKHGISEAHATALYLFLQIEQECQARNTKMKDVFGIDDAAVNVGILRGLLAQFDLLVAGDDSREGICQPKDVSSGYRYMLYWKSARDRFYDKKFQHYLTELRKVQLEMMDEIARVCDENNLTYVLNYGSLLGAVRHKGFIPWDDDVDICMPREDYEKFREIGKRELKRGCYPYSSEDYPDCWSSVMKVMKRDTVFVRHNYQYGEEDGQRVFIDVWPLDNVTGPERKEVERMKKTKSFLTRILSLKIKKRTGGELGRVDKIKMIFYRFVSEKWLIRTRRKVVTKWRNLQTDYWMSGGVYSYIKETMPKSWYLPTVSMPFEGHIYKFPGNYTEVLKHLYGNYMQLPPLEQRYTHAPLKVQMSEGGEVMYFAETQHRKRKTLRFKAKKKIIKLFRQAGEKINPFAQTCHTALLPVTGIFYRMTGKGRRLLAYQDKYKGKTCYAVVNSNLLTEGEIAAMEGNFTMSGEYESLFLKDMKWEPDFYCVSQNKDKNKRLPSWIAGSEKTQIFYTGSAAKYRKDQFKRAVRVPFRQTGDPYKTLGRMEKSYYDDGSGNMAFLLEMAVYMGFENIILTGLDKEYETYYMHHFADTEKLEKADEKYEAYQKRESRYAVIREMAHNKSRITEYKDIFSKKNSEK